MRRLGCLVAVSLAVTACGRTPEAPAADPVPEYRPYSNLAQMMRGISFPASNIIFDAQSRDPGESQRAGDASQGATAAFRHVYGGWQEVENNALALAETANLMLIPGRLCENGRPAPIDEPHYRQAAEQMAEAGRAAYAAAQTRSVDAIVEVSGTIADACANCHEVYRDKDDPKDRCIQ